MAPGWLALSTSSRIRSLKAAEKLRRLDFAWGEAATAGPAPSGSSLRSLPFGSGPAVLLDRLVGWFMRRFLIPLGDRLKCLTHVGT